MSSAEVRDGPFHKIVKRIKMEREDGSDTNCNDSSDTKTLQTRVSNRHPKTYCSDPPTPNVHSLVGDGYGHKSFECNKKTITNKETLEFKKGYESDMESDSSISTSDGDDSSDDESYSTDTDPISTCFELVEDLTLEEVCSNFIKRAQSEQYYNGQSLHRLVCEVNARRLITEGDIESFDNFHAQRGVGFRDPVTDQVFYI